MKETFTLITAILLIVVGLVLFLLLKYRPYNFVMKDEGNNKRGAVGCISIVFSFLGIAVLLWIFFK